MKQILILLMAVLMAPSFVRAEETDTAPDAAPPEVVAEPAGEAAAEPVVETAEPEAAAAWLPPAVIAFGDVDDQLVARAQQWAEANLAMPVPLLPAQPALQLGSFDEVAAAAAAMLETNRVGLVVVWRPNSDVMNHGAHFPDIRVSIANLNPMLTPDTEAETIERRVERQVIRGVCLLFGLEPSPNPYSAMFGYENLEQLDKIGRNLDPPWLKRVQERARDRGIPLDAESEKYMLR
jgi:hypothetical protein